MVYADLHVHTTRSDGSLPPETIPVAAQDAGIDVVAITDHDRLAPFDDSVVRRDGVTLVSAIELRVESEQAGRLDLLGYGITPTPALETLLERIQDDRRERGREIVRRVETHLDVDLDVDVDEGFGRPHVARAVDAHPEIEYSYAETFTELIGEDGPCYVPRWVPSFEQGRQILADAAVVVSLAHPLRYADPETALEVTGSLDAVEREYPYGQPVDLSIVDRAIDRHDLLVTGGSDAHDACLGRAGLSKAAFFALGLVF